MARLALALLALLVAEAEAQLGYADEGAVNVKSLLIVIGLVIGGPIIVYIAFTFWCNVCCRIGGPCECCLGRISKQEDDWDDGSELVAAPVATGYIEERNEQLSMERGGVVDRCVPTCCEAPPPLQALCSAQFSE